MPSVVVAPLAPRPLAVVHGRLTPDVEAVKKEKKDDDVCSSFVINAVVAVGVMVALLLGLFLFVVLPHLSQTAVPTGSYHWPPPSATSQLGKFRRAAVTTDHGLCSEIGRNVLIQGGNAVDSAVAVQFCLGVTNPQSAGLGGGFIMTIYNRSRSACEVIDARETAPGATHRDVFVNDPDGSKYGFRAVGVPGELAGLWMAFKRFGSGRVPWRSLLQPSIDLCKNGVPVSEYLAVTMQTKEYHFHLFPSMRDWINPRTNRTYEFGDLMPRPKLASTLERLAAATDPERLFYQGDMADTLAREFKRENGFITKEDLANYRARLHQKAEMNDHFHPDLVMCGPPPPSSFSVTQLIISIMAQIYPKANKSELYTSALFYHRFIEAMKFGYAQRTLLGDGDFVPKALKLAEKLTTRAATEEVLRKMNSRALPTADYGGVAQFQPPDHGTAHVSVIDAEGNGVSSTTTINRWFGAAVQSESLGIVWNDEMDDFSTPGTANGFGFAPSETNFIAPGKRPMSSMSPMVVFNKHTKKLRMVIGGSGGSKIISALSKAVIRVLLFGETIKEAIDAPMLHNQFTPDITQTDEFFPTDLRDELEQIFGQKFRNTSGFEGIIQGISVEDDAIYASGDFRRKTNQHAEGY